MTLQDAIQHVVAGRHLSESAARDVATLIMEGEATPSQIAALLVGLRMKGESVDEIAGFVRAMRAKATPVPVEFDELIDTCGTGGDGSGTFNISTVAAFVAAGAGCKVAKHGNRSVSSRCGSAEVLERLGVDIEQSPQETADNIRDIGLGFLFAPMYHGATRHAVTPRREIGVRSIFNIAGPLTHPAGAKRQVMGVFDGDLTEPLACVLRNLGSVHCLVLHGDDGLDEITLDAPTRISELKDGEVRTFRVTPEDLGLDRVPLDQLQGGDLDENARIATSVLRGEKSPAREIVLANAGAAIYVGGRAESLREGVVRAAESIDSGQALAILEALRRPVIAGSFLPAILQHKAKEIARGKYNGFDGPCDDSPPRSFRDALRDDGISIIAEFKRNSPSKGMLHPHAKPGDVARCYAENGAAALSVLTDETFFGGTVSDLADARAAVALPVLRKDFILDAFQVHEARHAGADAILLIVRALDAGRLRDLLQLSTDLEMDTLVEIHDRDELRVALDAGARIIGVNNRNLDTFEVRLETSLELRPLIPSECVAVAESGIRTPDDVSRLRDLGFDAILVGEALMTAIDPGLMLRELRGANR